MCGHAMVPCMHVKAEMTHLIGHAPLLQIRLGFMDNNKSLIHDLITILGPYTLILQLYA